MANGKGSLDCFYCRHYPRRAWMGASARCGYHKVLLPASDLNRVCVHFEPSRQYWIANTPATPPAVRFSWFHEDLEAGILYLFHYSNPRKMEGAIPLHKPD